MAAAVSPFSALGCRRAICCGLRAKMLPVESGGFGIVVHFVQHGLQVWRQGHAALLEFVCPGGGIEIAVLGEEFFGGGADFFVGSRLGNLRFAGLWFVSLRGLRAGGGGGHGGVFLAGGEKEEYGKDGGQAFHGFPFGMCFCLAEGYLKNGSGEVSGSLSAFAACQAEVPGADIEAHAEVAPEQGAAGGEGGGEGAQQGVCGGVGEQQGGVYGGVQLFGREVGGAGQGFGSGVLREVSGRRGGGEVGFEQQP